MVRWLLAAATVALLFTWGGAPAGASSDSAALVIEYSHVGDHRALLAKDDDWRDPALPAESRLIEGRAEWSPRTSSEPGEVPVASYTWGQSLRARVRVQLANEREPLPVLVGESTAGWLTMRPTAPGRRDTAGVIAFDMVAAEPLPRTITELAGQVRWMLVRDRRAVEIGRTRHRVLVTAGPPRRAEAWAVTGAGTEPRRPDHNAFTVFRLREAIRIAHGVSTAAAAAERAWRFAMYHYDLSADPARNPWGLLEEGTGGQCMTAGAFIEAVFKILGFENGRVAYVYPSLSRPTNPELTAIPHRRIPRAFTVEASEYDVRGQFRRLAAGTTTAGARSHSVTEAVRHRGAHGIERLKMRDGHGELHNYATAFIVEENGRRAYFGGGYNQGPYPTADTFLAAACTAVVWAYEEGDSGEWETICDAPDAGYWWKTGERFKP